MNMYYRLSFSLLVVLVTVLVGVVTAHGSACCGGATSFPALMTTDSKAQFSFGMRSQWTVADVDRDGEVRSRPDTAKDSIRAYSLTGVFSINERYQASVQVPVLSREVVAGTDPGWQTDLGDISLLGSFEFMPEKTYSPWKPRGFGYLRLTAPSGESIYDGNDPLLSSVSGQGFYGVGFGAAFVKVFGLWDVAGNVEWTHLSSRRHKIQGKSVLVMPGPKSSASIGFGYSPPDTQWRLGLSLGPMVTGRVSFSDDRPGSEARWVWDSTLSASYMMGDEWMAALSYRDQTLWGPARNTPLAREAGILLQRRFAQ